jgi:peptidoglycan/xylan/chitin deacetylase (PgdA/CDA1 family)
MRALPGEHDVRREMSALCAHHGVDEAAVCRELCMSWDELKSFAGDPLIGVGAHSVTHGNLARQAREIASQEMAVSRERIENVLQRPVLHLAYPYGDKIAAGAREFALAQAAGFKTAVTTRPGMIFPENAGHLTALPRVSLNGNYQDTRILPVLTSGAATAMWNGFRRIDAAQALFFAFLSTFSALILRSAHWRASRRMGRRRPSRRRFAPPQDEDGSSSLP